MYGLATIYFVTGRLKEGQTDRQTDDSIMPIADYTACSSTIG